MVLASTMAGCVKGGSDSTKADADGGKSTTAGETSGKIELEFFNQKKEGEGVYNEIIKMFQEENKNVVIKQVAPADAETVFFTRVSTNDIPDIMSIYPCETAYQTVMDEGLVAELTDEPFLKNATDEALEYSKYKDKLYAMPYALSSFGIFCNKDMFDAAGIAAYPKTWEELIDVCKKLKESGIEEPMIFADKDAGTLSQEGERLAGIIKNDIYKDTEAVGKGNGSFKDADKDYFKLLAEAMLEMRTFAPKDTLAIGREQATADFVNEKHAMYVGGTYSFAGILDAKPDMNVEMIPLPTPRKGAEQTLPINVDIALGYSAKTKYPEECKKFLEFVSRPEVYQKMADTEGTPPVIKGVEYNIAPLKLIKEEMETGKTFLTLVNFWPAGLRNEWAIYLQNLLTDDDIDAFLTETDRICVDYYNKDE